MLCTSHACTHLPKPVHAVHATCMHPFTQARACCARHMHAPIYPSPGMLCTPHACTLHRSSRMGCTPVARTHSEFWVAPSRHPVGPHGAPRAHWVAPREGRITSMDLMALQEALAISSTSILFKCAFCLNCIFIYFLFGLLSCRNKDSYIRYIIISCNFTSIDTFECMSGTCRE